MEQVHSCDHPTETGAAIELCRTLLFPDTPGALRPVSWPKAPRAPRPPVARARDTLRPPPVIPPFPAWARVGLAAKTPEESGFLAGAALVALHPMACHDHPISVARQCRGAGEHRALTPQATDRGSRVIAGAVQIEGVPHRRVVLDARCRARGSGGCGTRLRIWGSGVRISSGAPIISMSWALVGGPHLPRNPDWEDYGKNPARVRHIDPRSSRGFRVSLRSYDRARRTSLARCSKPATCSEFRPARTGTRLIAIG